MVRSIRVRDARGDELILFEFKRSYLRALARRRMMLDSGEVVKQVDEDTYQIVSTGEKLFRVK